MKQRTFKTRDQFGQPVYREYVDMDGVIAIGLRIATEEPHNARAQELATWLAQLGHKPTHDEFKAWVESKGAQLKQVESEDYEN